VKWPNDVWLDGLKVAGILVEARPAQGWAIVGVGLNVALDVRDLPPELHATAGTLGRARADLEPTLTELLGSLDVRLAQPASTTVAALRERDALLDQPVTWADGNGVGAGIDPSGGLRVRLADGRLIIRESGEVLLSNSAPSGH
jgi:BirA family biotin operon repressor/biotin-[acetyl-CoA-carboxylase] ligase